MFEVEKKFVVHDLQQIQIQILQEFGGEVQPAVHQSDLYLRHPSRDFQSTDEALRIRSVKVENGTSQVLITYKGPRRMQDAAADAIKTRREIEVLVSQEPAVATSLREMFWALGFQSSLTVSKTRRSIRTRIDEWPVEFALDAVDGLGDFLEIETVIDDQRIDEAQQVLSDISRQLGLSQATATSYLNMLTQKED